MKKLLLIVSTAALLVASSIAMAALNVGVLDMQKVMQNAPQVKVVQKQLRKKFAPQEKQLVAMQKQLRSDVENYEKNSSVMTASKKTDLQKKIAGEQQAFQKQQAAFRSKIVAAQNTAMRKIFKQIEGVVDGIASSQKLNLIVTKASVVYSDDNMDITNTVIGKLK